MSMILLIPGLLCDDTVWQSLLDSLHGKSVRVADLTTQNDLRVMAEDCLAQHNGPLLVVGHSMGARVALEITRMAPSRVQKLVLMDTGIHPLRDGEIEKRKEIVQFAHTNGMQALAERWLPGMVHTRHLNDQQLMQGLTDMVMRCDAELHERQINALVNRPDASQYLSEIQCPVLLVVGEQDQWSPVSQHEDMLQLLPNATLEVIENAGHFSLLEQAELVNQHLCKFLL